MFRRLQNKPIRALVVARRMAERTASDAPVGRKKLRPDEERRRVYNLAGEIAVGRVPLDDDSAGLVARALEMEHRRLRRQAGGTG